MFLIHVCTENVDHFPENISCFVETVGARQDLAAGKAVGFGAVGLNILHGHRFNAPGVIDQDLETIKAKEFSAELRVKTPTVEQLVGNLSGGNQQKVLLAKALFAEPDILMLDEPTRGVDVGAKYEIYEIINKMVSDGKSVLMVSSELPELLGMADRIYVMNEGHLVAEVNNDGTVTQEQIMGYILRDSNKDIAGIQTDNNGGMTA